MTEADKRKEEAEDFPESDKELVRKQKRFSLLSLSFYGPTELAQWKHKEEERLAAIASGAPLPDEKEIASMKTMSSSIK